MSDLNSPDWATANIALRRRRDEMDAFKRVEESTIMSNLTDLGRSLAQGGATATPRQQTHQQQNQVDHGFNTVRSAPRPVQPPSTTKRN